MLATFYLLAAFFAGLALVQRLFPNAPVLVRLAGAFAAGIVLTAWLTFVVAFGLSGASDDSVTLGIVASIAVDVVIVIVLRAGLRLEAFRLGGFEAIFLGLSLVFSFWLMDARLGGDPLTVSANTWGDTALHVALARSFDLGHNFPPEYPFFANEPIRYHFGYDFFAGALEDGGLPVQYAFNLPGALGFAAIMLLVFELGRWLFGREGDEGDERWWQQRGVWVGLIAVALLITNGSLAFLRYFDLYDNDIGQALSHLWDKQPPPFHDRYLAVGPYFVEGKIDQISIFWTLNVFLTQTHLIVAMAAVLFVAFGLLQPLRDGEMPSPLHATALGVLMGAAFWLNGVLYTAAMVFFVALLAVFVIAPAVRAWREAASPEERWKAASDGLTARAQDASFFVLPAVLLAVPQAIWLNGGLNNDGSLRWHRGYLVCSSPDASCNAEGQMDFLDPAHWWDFLEYWWLNLGFALPLMVLAAVFVGWRYRGIMLAVMAIFVFGSLVQLSRDLGGHNHKVFNLWEILMNVFVAFAFVQIAIWIADGAKRVWPPAVQARWAVAVLAVSPVFVLLVLSGIIDFATIKNDPRFAVFGDRQAVIEEIDRTTPGDSVILTAWGDLYTAPTMAGRRIFLGYEPWVGSAGYDLEPRKGITAAIYGAGSKLDACRMLQDNEIDFVLVGPAERSGQRFILNEQLFEQFTPAFDMEAPEGRFALYDVTASCMTAAVSR